MADRMRIMAVDDNTVNLATIEQELKDKYEVIPMLTGRRAIKYLYREDVDLILLDVQMPIMDGIDTLKEIRSLERGVTIPVIFLTARKDAATVVAGSELGIMDYITKPFDPDDLKSRIEQCFKRLGVLPMERDELFNRIVDISEDIKNGNTKPAIKKTEEVLRYQIDEDISGRMRVAKKKLELNDAEAGLAAVERVLTLLDREMDNGSKNVYPPISISEISARLLYAQDDIANFKLHDAAEKLNNLKDYDISDSVRRNVSLAIERIKEYDDEEAVKLIKQTLDTLNATFAQKPTPVAETQTTSTGAAYRSKYWSKK